MNGINQEKKIPKSQQKIFEKLKDFVEKAPEKNLYHINVYKIAERTGIERSTMLSAFIQGVTEGLFTMEWVYHCPHCGGIANETITIHEARHDDYCEKCKVQFNNVLDESIEVFFSVHPEKRQIDIQYSKTYHDNIMQTLEAGYYLWRDDSNIRGIDVVQNITYRNLMGADVLLDDQSLEIKRACILFTDIKGSTQMYSVLGDARAFKLVREHFRILFAVIEEYEGVPVKTIGDAVMGVFNSRKIALACVLEAQKRLHQFYADKPDDEKIEVKIGLHSGATIVVTLNSRLDYFGTTVNTAARIQGVAEPNEVVISDTILEADDAENIIASYGAKIKKTKESFKGIKGKVPVYRLTI